MEIRNLKIEGVLEIIPRIFEDNRGNFLETYNQEIFHRNHIDINFVQDNQSFSKQNVLRGLHFQFPPYEQGKLVRVAQGKALDIAVDIRPRSSTFGKYISCILDGKRNNMLYIPVGFAHGFLALTDVILTYKCTRTYHRESEGGIVWNDRELAIDWGIDKPLVSHKDSSLPDFRTYRNALVRDDKSHNTQ